MNAKSFPRQESSEELGSTTLPHFATINTSADEHRVKVLDRVKSNRGLTKTRQERAVSFGENDIEVKLEEPEHRLESSFSNAEIQTRSQLMFGKPQVEDKNFSNSTSGSSESIGHQVKSMANIRRELSESDFRAFRSDIRQ